MGDADGMLDTREGGGLVGLKDLGDAGENAVLKPKWNASYVSHERSLNEGLADGAAGDEGLEQFLADERHRILGIVFGELERKTILQLAKVIEAAVVAGRFDREVLRESSESLSVFDGSFGRFPGAVGIGPDLEVCRYG